jgi:hypothetical protein
VEIQINDVTGTKKIVAQVLETDQYTITLSVFEDNTASIKQNAVNYLPSIKDFHTEMDKRSTKFNLSLSLRIGLYLNEELQVPAYKARTILTEIEALFPKLLT